MARLVNDQKRKSGWKVEQIQEGWLAEKGRVKEKNKKFKSSNWKEEKFESALKEKVMAESEKIWTVKESRSRKREHTLERGELATEISKALKASREASTIANYRSTWRAWCRFCTTNDLDKLSVTEMKLKAFAAQRWKNGCKADTVMKDITKLRSVLSDHGIKVQSMAEMSQLRRLLQGLKNLDANERQRTVRRRAPITTQHLRLMVRAINSTQLLDSDEKLVYGTLFKVMFFGFLRVGEGIRKKNGGGEWSTPFLNRHVTWRVAGEGRMAVLQLPKSKTDKTGMRFKISLNELHESNKEICPVRALVRLIKHKADESGDDELFGLEGKSIRITYKKAMHWTREALSVAGFNARKYGTHSFRIGATTSAFAIGMSVDEVKMLGRWSSNAVERYRRMSVKWRAKTAAQLQCIEEIMEYEE